MARLPLVCALVAAATRRPHPCAWCGREVIDTGMGRRRQYCRQSCRQRAYEHRSSLRGTTIPENAVVLSAEEAAALSDRAFAVRCAAEDVATALDEEAPPGEVRQLVAQLTDLARDAERLR
ncbi:hypothetical protein HT102_10020 [Hoyosella sp. G463]|uniref:FCS-type domain-containing protein n=1 Tax=Lolliginicoccus lacisalsi TaxID=2742202 RepID=A0A927PMH1_9ACTN|nr:hypothetical protein [Lolliginicoccus lacisalsi]MBD8506824.1 hypothetical protein [Lolliginicoccus lacisalsi]